MTVIPLCSTPLTTTTVTPTELPDGCSVVRFFKVTCNGRTTLAPLHLIDDDGENIPVWVASKKRVAIDDITDEQPFQLLTPRLATV